MSTVHAEARAAIQDTLLRLFHGVDALRWEEVRGAFAAQVTTDYTSLFGGAPATQAADDLVAAWRGLLPGFDATQHLLGPMLIEADGAEARVECQVVGDHRLRGAQGGEMWRVVGRYDLRLTRRDSGWAVTHLTLHTAWQEGNGDLVPQALARAASSPRT